MVEGPRTRRAASSRVRTVLDAGWHALARTDQGRTTLVIPVDDQSLTQLAMELTQSRADRHRLVSDQVAPHFDPGLSSLVVFQKRQRPKSVSSAHFKWTFEGTIDETTVTLDGHSWDRGRPARF